MKYSTNVKLQKVLTYIESELVELGIDEVVHYMKEFKYEPDYNLAQYGNLTVYYDDIRKIYGDYKSLAKASNKQIWEIYKRQVGFVARKVTKSK